MLDRLEGAARLGARLDGAEAPPRFGALWEGAVAAPPLGARAEGVFPAAGVLPPPRWGFSRAEGRLVVPGDGLADGVPVVDLSPGDLAEGLLGSARSPVEGLACGARTEGAAARLLPPGSPTRSDGLRLAPGWATDV